LHDIIVVGSLNMDLVIRVQKMPELGETVRGSDLLTIPGGKGANQAAAAAKLGNNVLMVGKVGGDSFGVTLKQNLHNLGVNTDRVAQEEESSTGTAVITVDDAGNNCIVISAGANGKVSLADVEALSGLWSETKMLLLQLEIPLDVVSKAIDIAYQNNVPIALNPSPIADLPKELLRKVKYLILNEIEAKSISGIEASSVESSKSAAKKILAMGVENVIITLGEHGAVLANQNTTVHVPAIKVKPVDTTAAGDAFTAGFVSGVLKGFSLEDAVRFGNCSGALTATKNGAQSSLPDYFSVHDLFSSRKTEI
jgi:ribokinase